MTATIGIVDRLTECIGLRGVTPPGEAREVAAWLASWCRALGASVTLPEVWAGAHNVIADFDFGPGPTVVFNSHMDVVDPAGQEWSCDPFVATQAQGRLYGRGACDAKGSLVSMVKAIERLVTGGGSAVAGRVLLTAVVGEEAGGLGSKHLVSHGLQADAAVVGEPTELSVARAHKGTYMHLLSFRGRAAHSASPWRGHNAIADAAAFVAASEEENQRLALAPHSALGPATMTVTTGAGGTFQNTVPDRAQLTVDRRLIPGETHHDCDLEMRDLLQRLASRRPGLDVEVTNLVATVPSETAADASIVRAALAAVASVGRTQEGATGFNAGCDMSKLVGAGIPTVICGPGSLDQAHGPDEYVDVKQLHDAVDVYERLARLLLKPDQTRPRRLATSECP